MLFAAATALLGVSIAGLVGLFALKRYEHTRGVVYAAYARSVADAQARTLKEWIMFVQRSLHRVPALMLLIGRYLVHIGAKAFARLAKRMEKAAHDLADRVSHKHTFKRRVTRSKFLKQVTERVQGEEKETVI